MNFLKKQEDNVLEKFSADSRGLDNDFDKKQTNGSKQKKIEQNILDIRKKALINKISNVKSVNELDEVFRQVISNRYMSKFRLQNFNNAIFKIKSSLMKIKHILSLPGRTDILDKLVDVFLTSNRSILGHSESESDQKRYLKNNLLTDYFDLAESKGVVVDILKAHLIDEDVKIGYYQDFNVNFINYLMNHIYENSNREFNDSLEQSKISKSNQFNVFFGAESIPYSGQDDSFHTQLNILHDRKKLVERQRQSELAILNRSYPVVERDEQFCSKANNLFAEKFRRQKGHGEIFGEQTIELKPRASLGYTEHQTHEDIMYNMVNIFYDNKYIKIDNQERELIKKHEKALRDKTNKKIQRNSKNYLRSNLNIESELGFMRRMPDRHRGHYLNFENDDDFLKCVFRTVANKVNKLVCGDVHGLGDVSSGANLRLSELNERKHNDVLMGERQPSWSFDSVVKVGHLVDAVSSGIEKSGNKDVGSNSKKNNEQQ